MLSLPLRGEIVDVVGGSPCVPAYLAGHPLNMRRRERVLSEQGPLTVFASMELSASIDIETMRQRGASILALVRVLSNARPVTLYCCVSVGGRDYAAHIMVRIDTSPLDLARAAHIMTCPSVTRGLGYSLATTLCKDHLSKDWGGGWAYGCASTYRDIARQTFASVTEGGDTLLMPAAHSDDPCVKEPVQWLKDMVAKYGGGITEDM